MARSQATWTTRQAVGKRDDERYTFRDGRIALQDVYRKSSGG